MDSIGYLGIFVALVGLVGALWAWRGHARARALVEAATRWLTAPGKVVGADVERRGVGDRNASYVPRIGYSYVVNGRERTGSRLRFGYLRTRTRAGAEAMLAPYPVGADVQVRYDPDNPDESVLESGKVAGNQLVFSILCAIIFLGGAAIVVLAVMGVFSSDVSGHWHVRFTADNIAYEGDLEAIRAAGPLTLAFTDAEGHKRVREDCTLTRNRQHVLVRCANPQMLEGNGTYSPDNFDLTYEGASRLIGSVTSNGADVGAVTFSR